MSEPGIGGWKKFWRAVPHYAYPVAGFSAAVLGFVASVTLAYAASSVKPPSAAQSAIYVIVAGLFQLTSAWLFSKRTPSISGIRNLLRRHVRLGEQVDAARTLAEDAFDDGSAARLRAAMGELSVRLSQLELDHQDVAFEWLELNRRLLAFEEEIKYE